LNGNVISAIPKAQRNDKAIPEAQQTKFPSARPPHHANEKGTLFRNPWPSAVSPTWTEMTSAPWPIQWAKSALSTHPKARLINVIPPTWQDRGKGKEKVQDDLRLNGTWLGHASALVELPSSSSKPVRILFDPIFSFRAGPTAYTGVSRLLSSPCKVEDLPKIHVVAISHSHYDHLDSSSIVALHKRFPDIVFCVPLGQYTQNLFNEGNYSSELYFKNIQIGLREWFTSIGILEWQVVEFDWWEELCIDLDRRIDGIEVQESMLRITSVPAQHNSGQLHRVLL